MDWSQPVQEKRGKLGCKPLIAALFCRWFKAFLHCLNKWNTFLWLVSVEGMKNTHVEQVSFSKTGFWGTNCLVCCCSLTTEFRCRLMHARLLNKQSENTFYCCIFKPSWAGIYWFRHGSYMNCNCIWEWFAGRKRNWVDSLLKVCRIVYPQVLWCGSASLLKFGGQCG